MVLITETRGLGGRQVGGLWEALRWETRLSPGGNGHFAPGKPNGAEDSTAQGPPSRHAQGPEHEPLHSWARWEGQQRPPLTRWHHEARFRKVCFGHVSRCQFSQREVGSLLLPD